MSRSSVLTTSVKKKVSTTRQSVLDREAAALRRRQQEEWEELEREAGRNKIHARIMNTMETPSHRVYTGSLLDHHGTHSTGRTSVTAAPEKSQSVLFDQNEREEERQRLASVYSSTDTRRESLDSIVKSILTAPRRAPPPRPFSVLQSQLSNVGHSQLYGSTSSSFSGNTDGNTTDEEDKEDKEEEDKEDKEEEEKEEEEEEDEEKVEEKEMEEKQEVKKPIRQEGQRDARLNMQDAIIAKHDAYWKALRCDECRHEDVKHELGQQVLSAFKNPNARVLERLMKSHTPIRRAVNLMCARFKVRAVNAADALQSTGDAKQTVFFEDPPWNFRAATEWIVLQWIHHNDNRTSTTLPEYISPQGRVVVGIELDTINMCTIFKKGHTRQELIRGLDALYESAEMKRRNPHQIPDKETLCADYARMLIDLVPQALMDIKSYSPTTEQGRKQLHWIARSLLIPMTAKTVTGAKTTKPISDTDLYKIVRKQLEATKHIMSGSSSSKHASIWSQHTIPIQLFVLHGATLGEYPSQQATSDVTQTRIRDQQLLIRLRQSQLRAETS